MYRQSRRVFPALFAILTILSIADSDAQAQQLKARLAPLPVTFQTVNIITGSGAVRARLDGRALTLEGSFEGLSGPATQAFLHHGPLAIPGPAVAELIVSRATHGQVSGVITLNDDMLAALNANAIYLQIHSETAPNGSIRGWLLPMTP